MKELKQLKDKLIFSHSSRRQSRRRREPKFS